MEDLLLSKHYVDDILDNIHEKLESGFYLDKINIDGREFEIFEKTKEYLVLLCKNGDPDDAGDGLAVRLPLPLRFDEEWFKKYKEINITRGSVICYHIEGYLKNDLKE